MITLTGLASPHISVGNQFYISFMVKSLIFTKKQYFMLLLDKLSTITI